MSLGFDPILSIIYYRLTRSPLMRTPRQLKLILLSHSSKLPVLNPRSFVRISWIMAAKTI